MQPFSCWRWKKICNIFGILYFIISREVKTPLKWKKKLCSGWRRCCDWLNVSNGLQSFLVLWTFWPNNSLLWGCLRHWKTFSSTLGHYPLEANSRRLATYSKHPNPVIGENENCVFYFMKKTKQTFWPTWYRGSGKDTVSERMWTAGRVLSS